MNPPTNKLTRDAIAIWQSGVDAVRADRVIEQQTTWDGRWLTIADQQWDLKGIHRLIVVGAGKATAGLLCGLVNAFGKSAYPVPRMQGWINVPQGAASLSAPIPDSITVCEARPQGKNEPTELVVLGTQHIMDAVRNATSHDCVLVLLSGGGSALLCAPAPGVTLADKVLLTKDLSASGANIEELNAVRRCLSVVKGGGLARLCKAKYMITCVLSDVLGDPLEFIASGPTILDPIPDPAKAIAILHRYLPNRHANILAVLNKESNHNAIRNRNQSKFDPSTEERFSHLILANNATAVDAAGQKAVELGYRYWMQSQRKSEGDVVAFAKAFSRQIQTTRDSSGIDCLISGGEPTVCLPPEATRGIGGRNQQLALEILRQFIAIHGCWPSGPSCELAFVSGGTDGEDGPTDAAGAYVDANVFTRMHELGLDPSVFAQRFDAYAFFQQCGGLLITGPTHTNVCDLRVALVGPE
jgi:hydroxypyruvate reductase